MSPLTGLGILLIRRCYKHVAPPGLSAFCLLTFRSDVAAARLDGELAVGLLGGGLERELELADGAVVLAVRRDEGELVARAEVLDQRDEGAVEGFWLVVEYFAGGLVGRCCVVE